MAISHREDYSGAACELLRWGVQIVVITRAKNGASAITHDPTSNHIMEYRQAINAVDICDTTGAGDAFAGAFLVEWVSSGDIFASLRAASLAGACAVSVQGASTMVTDDEAKRIEERLFPSEATSVEILCSL